MGLLALALAARSRSAFADDAPCQPATLAASVRALPDLWQRALDDLLDAASGAGQPWDCSGARVDVELRDDDALLSVELPDGRKVSRPVPSPDLLKATGEALLAGADFPDPTPEPAKEQPATRVPPRGAPPPNPPARHDHGAPSATRSSRIVFDAGLSGRVTKPPTALWGGGVFRVTIPFGAWSGAAWVRFDLPAYVFDHVPPDFSMSDVCVGLALGRRFIEHPVELRVSIGPALGVISEEGGYEPDFHEGSRPEIRLGSDVQVTWPFARILRYFIASDFELSPQNFSGKRRIDPALPPLPAFSFGLSSGLGIAIP